MAHVLPWLLLCLGSGVVRAGRAQLGILVPLRNGLGPPAQGHRVQRAAEGEQEDSKQGSNFVDMIDNLRGKSGQGYYVEMTVGSPPQKVRRCPETPGCRRGLGLLRQGRAPTSPRSS